MTQIKVTSIFDLSLVIDLFAVPTAMHVQVVECVCMCVLKGERERERKEREREMRWRVEIHK